MKINRFKRKALTALLVLCVVLSIVPITALAAAPATETANFAYSGGTAAIALLNKAKTGTADSTWDNSSKTLTLRGIDFTTTASVAVKLPSDSTIVLADGTSNTIQSGDVTLDISDNYKNQAFVNAMDAAGNLTIQGGTAGTGTLSIFAGKLKNKGDGWVYSSGMAVNGDLTVKGGQVTARGGSVESGGSCFSIGVNMDSDIKNKSLLVTGGTLTAIADEAYELEDGGTKRAVFSRGVYMYRGNVIVSGDGKLRAESVEKMADATLLSNGLYISMGGLTVANSAEVAVAGAYGAYISGGGIQISGGKITAQSTQAPDVYGNLGNAVYVDADNGTANAGNITVSGGTLETVNGEIYMSTFGAKENQGLFIVSGGTIVNRGRLYGPKKLDISGGTVQTQGIDADELILSGGSVTVREPVRKSSYSGELWARPAVDVMALTVSDGKLDAAWNWGEYTPMVLPKDEEYNDVGILVRIPYDANTATFIGGTTILDTGFAGNTALLIKGQLTLGEGMSETGADVNHRQLSSNIPVKFAAAPVQKIIKDVSISDATLSYNAGNAPKATAKGNGETAPRYAIAYECWEEMSNETGELLPVAYWYSDESQYTSSMKKIDQFEEGKTYMYSILLKAADEWTFAAKDAGLKMTLNGEKINLQNVTVGQDGTILFAYALKTIKPTQTPITTDYKITEGANGVWTQNTDGTLTFRANGDISKFAGVKVDGNVISADNYTVAADSTVVTLKTDYLGTLSVGKHTLTVVYTDGECSTDFEIKAAQNDNSGDNASDKPSDNIDTPEKSDDQNANFDKAPYTGDSGNNALWITLLCVSCSALFAVAISKKRALKR